MGLVNSKGNSLDPMLGYLIPGLVDYLSDFGENVIDMEPKKIRCHRHESDIQYIVSLFFSIDGKNQTRSLHNIKSQSSCLPDWDVSAATLGTADSLEDVVFGELISFFSFR
jgi:hypothetical protein